MIFESNLLIQNWNYHQNLPLQRIPTVTLENKIKRGLFDLYISLAKKQFTDSDWSYHHENHFGSTLTSDLFKMNESLC